MRAICVFVLLGVGLWHEAAYANPSSTQNETSVRLDLKPRLGYFDLSSPSQPAFALPGQNRRWHSDAIQSEPLSKAPLKPPVEWGLIMLQGFGGAIVSSVSSFLLQSFLDILLINNRAQGDTKGALELSGVVSATVVLTVVPWLVALTVWGVGRLSNNYYSSYWWTLLGAYVGQFAAFGLGLLLTFIDPTPDKAISRGIRFVLDGVIAGVGAVVTYTLFRTPYEGIQHISSLTQFDRGKWRWGVPLPRIVQEPQQTTVYVPLASGRF